MGPRLRVPHLIQGQSQRRRWQQAQQEYPPGGDGVDRPIRSRALAGQAHSQVQQAEQQGTEPRSSSSSLQNTTCFGLTLYVLNFSEGS